MTNPSRPAIAMGPRAAAWLLLAVALAGCSGNEDEAEAAARALRLEAPTWAVGDSWTYANTGPEGAMGSMTIVVTGEEGGDYIVDTNEPTTAYFHAVEEISYLGKVRKSDLAGSQGADRVQYFDFPLEANKSWTTTWDGLRVQVTVQEVTPAGASLQAMAGARVFADYTFASGFLGDITFYDENGTAFVMELTHHDRGFSGTVYRYTIAQAMVYEAQEATMQGEGLDLGDATELAIVAEADCGGAAAGKLGGIFTEREPDQLHVPQAVLAIDPAYAYEWDCSTGQTDRAEAELAIDPAMAYSLDMGAAAPGGTLVLTLEPRVLQSIQVP